MSPSRPRTVVDKISGVSGPTAIQVDWRKWMDTPYRTTPMQLVTEDEHGTWLRAPRGAAATYASSGPAPLPVNFISLIPDGAQWWIATWMSGNEQIDIDLYVDIVHPPTWSPDGRSVRVIDLDLDVIVRRDATVFLDDEDEFEEHSISLGYPTDVITKARETARRTLAAIEAHEPPFDGAHLRIAEEFGLPVD
jgi:hypothetical protein